MFNNMLHRSRQFRTSSATHRFALVLPVLLLITWFGMQGTYSLGAAKQPTASYAQEGPRTLSVHPSGWPKQILELVGVNNLQSEEFPKGFGLRIKNISGKPIYYIQVNVRFLDSGQMLPGGGMMELRYGASRLNTTHERPGPEDLVLNPGETITLGPTEDQEKNFFTFLDRETRQNFMANGINRIELGAQRTSFGDGTGYIGNAQYPVAVIKKVVNSVSVDGCILPDCFNNDFFDHTEGCPDHPGCTWQYVYNSGSSFPCRRQLGRTNVCGCWAVEDQGDCNSETSNPGKMHKVENGQIASNRSEITSNQFALN